ncbi:putative polysaccharide biosynthesis protein [Latilactobacillus graminis]|uniref:Polysaccharide biosynthesis family protein n=2 Tax=Latilactobacillus graminis TaxID=60519 RepID=A0AA89I2N1_9LACO|nr:polysaccharide biosynthesis protein [Latilactobacillus graminis]KRM24463.1 polysaccharide biosynthesis family protein [Latilactobacillus graminis DSM 20719]QFP79079.1 polysaccharide biosynthesis protein [Latilactobacillus graminis]
MQNRQMQHLMKGAVILSIASFIAKVLSAIYRVPFQNMVGNTGFYVYQQVYPIYGIGMTFALSGFPVYISKLVAEQVDPEKRMQLLRRTFVLLGIFGGGVFIYLQNQAPRIAATMADPALTPLIKMVSFMFLLMPFLAVTRGYFQGLFNMLPTAISQVAEQLVRVIVILVAAWLSLKCHWSVYKMGMWAMSGAFFGGLVATGILLRSAATTCQFKAPQQTKLDFKAYRQLARRLVIEGGSICLFASLIVLLQLVDSFTVKKGLVLGGLSENLAKNMKGIFDRGQPLVQLGLVVSLSFSSTLVPSLSQARQRHQHHQFQQVATALIHISLGLSAAATIGLIGLMPQINYFLFGDTDGNLALVWYMLSIIMIALINACNSVLQSLDQFHKTTVALIGGLLVKILINQWLVQHYDIMGASVGTVISLGVVLALILRQSPTVVIQALDLRRFIGKLSFICSIMWFGVKMVMWLVPQSLSSRGHALLGTALGVLVGMFVFGGLALHWQLFSIREWLTMPGGRQLLRLSKKIKGRTE